MIVLTFKWFYRLFYWYWNAQFYQLTFNYLLFRGDSEDHGSDPNVQRVNTFVERYFDSLLIDFGETAFIGFEDFVTNPEN